MLDLNCYTVFLLQNFSIDSLWRFDFKIDILCTNVTGVYFLKAKIYQNFYFKKLCSKLCFASAWKNCSDDAQDEFKWNEWNCVWHKLMTSLPLIEICWKVQYFSILCVYYVLTKQNNLCLFKYHRREILLLHEKYSRLSSKYVKIVKQNWCFVSLHRLLTPCLWKGII